MYKFDPCGMHATRFAVKCNKKSAQNLCNTNSISMCGSRQNLHTIAKNSIGGIKSKSAHHKLILLLQYAIELKNANIYKK